MAGKWTMFNRTKYSVVVTTNNGTEVQKKVLKEYYLKSRRGRQSLSSLVSVLIRQFLPEQRTHFLQEQMRRSSVYRKYHSTIPEYLHNRPPKVIKHVMQRMDSSQQYTKDDVSVLPEEGTFMVSPSNPGQHHVVDFNAPCRTSEGFKKHKLPCKHFGAVFLLVGGWSSTRLPVTSISSAHLNVGSNIHEPDGTQLPSLPLASTIKAVHLDSLPQKPKQGLGAFKERVQNATNRLRNMAGNMAVYCNDKQKLDAVYEH
ncbi:unnamed protein product [Ixodes hexagonus]